jgi:hypothetical protein
MILPKCLSLTALLLLAGGMSMGHAQDNAAAGSPSGSLGDAARKARAEKKDSGRPAKVFTNDDMGGLRGTISVIGTEPAPPSSATAKATQTPAADKGAPASASDKAAAKTEDKKPASGDSKKESAKDEAYWRATFAAARKLLAQDTKELDVLQREYNLKLEQYSQDPNWALHQQNSREDINKTQSEIETKKQDVEKDKQALSDLQDELRKSGGEPGWANEPSGAS